MISPHHGSRRYAGFVVGRDNLEHECSTSVRARPLASEAVRTQRMRHVKTNLFHMVFMTPRVCG